MAQQQFRSLIGEVLFQRDLGSDNAACIRIGEGIDEADRRLRRQFDCVAAVKQYERRRFLPMLLPARPVGNLPRGDLAWINSFGLTDFKPLLLRVAATMTIEFDELDFVC